MIFSKRVIEPEILDHVPPEEARPNLADLVRINKRFGGHSAILQTLKRAAGKQASFSLLDIGAASGDTARVIRRAYPAARITSLDYNETNLGAAPYPKIIANAFDLPFNDESFDFVLCSLFLHHFSDEEVVSLLSSFYRIAKRALVVCDLERHILPFLFLPATRGIFKWNDITVRDGKISVRAAFRRNELETLARKAAIKNPQVQVRRPAFRLAMIAAK